MNRRILAGISLAVAALTVAAATLPLPSADTRVEATPPAIRTTTDTAPGTAAMRAYIDPETGALDVRAGAAASATAASFDPETENALRRDAENLVETRHPDGAVSINLDGRFQSVSVLRMTEAGDVIECTDDAVKAGRVLTGQVTPEVK